MRGLPVAIAVLLFIGAGFVVRPALALDPARSIGQFHHTRWTAEEGAPWGVNALAQTPDGYLWLGSDAGLFRFDGMTFEPMPLLADRRKGISERVVSLLVTRRGALLVGYSTGGIGVYENGAARQIQARGLTVPTILAMKEDKDGVVWAALGSAVDRLARLSNGRWELIGAKWGLPDRFVQSMFVARDGALWIGMNRQVFRLPRGGRRFERVDGEVAIGPGLAQGPDGLIWLSDTLGARPFATADGLPVAGLHYPVAQGTVQGRLAFDRDGNLWGTTYATGAFRLARWPGAWSPELMTRQEGLTSDLTADVFEDREGNVWIATAGGLDRFRAANVVQETLVESDSFQGYAQFVDSKGVVWIGGRDTVYSAQPGQPLRPVLKAPPYVMAICEGPNGEIWVLGGGRTLRRLHPGGGVSFLNAPVETSRMAGCIKDGQGRMWLSAYEDGLLRYDGRGWKQFLGNDRDLWTTVIGRDSRGRVISETRSALTRWEGDSATPITYADRFVRSRINTVHQGPDDFLVGADGIVKVVGTREVLLSARRFPWMQNITGIGQTRDGETWIMTRAGVVRIETFALAEAFRNPSAPLPHRIFGRADGLRGAQTEMAFTDIVIGGDGRVWATTNAGVFSIDRARLAMNRLKPPVVISAVTVDGVRHPRPGDIVLPKGSRDLKVEFAALSLTAPERNRYLYKLEGYDRDWIDPGDRREAFYANLSPGSYVFRVKAANNDGVWNETGASVGVRLPPTFLQSYWFTALAVAGGALIVWLGYRLRLRQITDKIRLNMQARMVERERIARELHDTLIQGVQGLLLKLYGQIAQVAPRRVRQDMEVALDQGEAVLIETRERVRTLRTEATGDLTATLMATASRMTDDDGPTLSVATAGDPREVRPEVVDEIEKIVAEALFNALRHANATAVVVGIDFGRQELAVRVRDDGGGIDSGVLERGGRAGHYGIGGMRERAAQVRGTLTIRRIPDGGSEVALLIPAAIAYAEARSPIWSRLVSRVSAMAAAAPRR